MNFIRKIRDKYKKDDICIYMDNLAVHRSKDVREYLDQLSIPYVFNPPYSPDFNGIESVFSIYKNELKRERLKAIVNGYEIDLAEETQKIFSYIEKEKIVNCIKFSLNKLFNYKF